MNDPTELNRSGFQIYCGDLPHWRDNCVIYFVKWRLNKSASHLEPNERDLVAQTLEHFDKFRFWLAGYVVMDDHVHVVVKLIPGGSLQKTVHGWKSYTANRLQRIYGREGAVWQSEYYDRIIRDADEMRNILTYIANNPIKRWPEATEYTWLRICE